MYLRNKQFGIGPTVLSWKMTELLEFEMQKFDSVHPVVFWVFFVCKDLIRVPKEANTTSNLSNVRLSKVA